MWDKPRVERESSQLVDSQSLEIHRLFMERIQEGRCHNRPATLTQDPPQFTDGLAWIWNVLQNLRAENDVRSAIGQWERVCLA